MPKTARYDDLSHAQRFQNHDALSGPVDFRYLAARMRLDVLEMMMPQSDVYYITLGVGRCAFAVGNDSILGHRGGSQGRKSNSGSMQRGAAKPILVTRILFDTILRNVKWVLLSPTSPW